MFGRVAKVSSICCSCYYFYCLKIIITYCLLSYIHVLVSLWCRTITEAHAPLSVRVVVAHNDALSVMEIGVEEHGGGEGKSEDSVSAADWEILLDTNIESMHARKKEKAKKCWHQHDVFWESIRCSTASSAEIHGHPSSPWTCVQLRDFLMGFLQICRSTWDDRWTSDPTVQKLLEHGRMLPPAAPDILMYSETWRFGWLTAWRSTLLLGAQLGNSLAKINSWDPRRSCREQLELESRKWSG